MRKIAAALVTALTLTVGAVTPALALKPELTIPDKVSHTHKSCQEITRLGKKYHVEALFSKEFEEGKCQLSRMDVAIAVQFLTEKIAERVAKEGPEAVDKEDLALLADLREELRSELILAQTRAFQNRYTELGTNLHALTKNITMSGGMTGVVQGSVGNNSPALSEAPDYNGERKDHVDVVGRADLVFNFKITDTMIAVIDVEATGGRGIDPHVPNYSILNNVPMLPTDTVRFRTAWVEQSLFNERFVYTVGKINLTDYFDSNAVANNENTQFLAGAFTNDAVLGAPLPGPGLRATYRPTENVSFSLGYGSGTTDKDGQPIASDIVDHGYGIAELDYKLKLGSLDGNYRACGFMDGSVGIAPQGPNHALGTGLSVDQQLTEKLTLFGRYGWRDHDLYRTVAAWSGGLQYLGIIPTRADDILAFAYGQIQIKGAPAQEKLIEGYYRIKATEQVAVSPHLQYLIDPLGDTTVHNVLVASLRVQLTF
ncbi:carbohydrate porin [Geomesophilobacter sediminis]|uniref:Carbohydrate porin n=1 Tax=Geomesophilobacter sediminis TaxID=2798584 RepID=A0A8J7JEM5_9BACT|nr:carbohydrate porin [Geomesophilobacter sediminis]MBJ6726143.1 carbohydrate porin [Geomesophilobacter sediminis]